MSIIILDCEASGLSAESYPIEIGFVLEDGEVHSDLIKPEPGWTYWNTESEKIHNIKREELDNGLSAYDMALKLNSQLTSCTVYSDAVDYEVMWLNRLFDAAGIERKFDVRSLYDLLTNGAQYCLYYAAKDNLFKSTVRHRAGNDAKVMQLAYMKSRQSFSGELPRDLGELPYP